MTLITTQPKLDTDSRRAFSPYLHDGELRPEIVIICAATFELFEAGSMEPTELAEYMQEAISHIELWGDRTKLASPELSAQFRLLGITVVASSALADLPVLVLLKELAARLQSYIEAEGLDN